MALGFSSVMPKAWRKYWPVRIWITGAATQGEAEGAGTADERARLLRDYGSQGGVRSSGAEDTDSIVDDRIGSLEAPEAGATADNGTPPRTQNEAADEAAAPQPAAT